MDANEEKILARELGKLGALGGLGGALTPGAAIGGYLGAALTARFLPTHTFSTSLEVAAPASDGLRAAAQILRRVGRLTDEFADDSPQPALCGVVGAGALNMNPAVVRVTVTPISEAVCTIGIAGAAKEGLIKQHTAEKAVTRVKAELLHELSPSGDAS